MNNNAKQILLPVMALLAACSAPPANMGKLEVVLTKRNNLIVLDLVNNSTIKQAASSGYAFAGAGGGNIHAIIVSDFGRLVPPCNPVDDSVEFWNGSFIDAGKSLEIWSGTPQQLATFHCLEKGRYTLALGYQKPSGEIIFSNQAELVVSGERKLQGPYVDARLELKKTPAMWNRRGTAQ